MKRICFNRLTCGLRALAFLSLFLISPLCQLCHAAIITVPGDYSTIQAAIDAASDADEIIVSPGTCYENINFNGKNIILRSSDPTSPTVVANTVIDGRSTDSVVKFLGTESPNCVLSGFTITNGRVYYEGGGIYGNGTRATIQNSNITANTAWHWYKSGIGSGGGLYDCDGRIENNNISGNRAGGQGGGLHGCDGTICNNTISGNNPSGDGGGLSNCNGTIRNNIISGNVAAYGIGGGLYYCSGTIQNNTICSNEAYAFGGGLYWCDGTIQSNTIAGNRGGVVQGCTLAGDLLLIVSSGETQASRRASFLIAAPHFIAAFRIGPAVAEGIFPPILDLLIRITAIFISNLTLLVSMPGIRIIFVEITW